MSSPTTAPTPTRTKPGITTRPKTPFKPGIQPSPKPKA